MIGMIAGGLAFLYIAAASCLYVAMRQPPERFGALMSEVPMAAMMILPFKPLWMPARAGPLAVGDAAPRFCAPGSGPEPHSQAHGRMAGPPARLF